MGPETKPDLLRELWELQEEQQRELGLDPGRLSDVERHHLHGDLINLLHEEATELGRVRPTYKRHILRAASQQGTVSAAALECADVLKTLLALTQLHGVSVEQLRGAFYAKTAEVRNKAQMERIELHERTKLIATDLDDVICDLSPWREELGIHDEREASAALRLEASESMKNSFYNGGRFREMVPIPGARETLQKLREAEFRIVIITARPQWQYKRLHSDTALWLQDHGIPYDLLLFSRNKLEALYEHVVPAWPAVFVEDHPDNARSLAENGVDVLLYSQPHNANFQPHNKVRRVSDWNDIAQIFGV